MFRTQTLAYISSSLMFGLFVLTAAYMYFVLGTVHFAGALRQDVRAVRQLSIEISDLESDYSQMVSALSLEHVTELGFVPAAHIVYLGAERTVLAQIR